MRRSWSTIGFLAAVAGCGLIGAAWWTVVAGAWGMTSLRFETTGVVVDRYAAALGRVSAWGLFATAALAGNAVACTAAFVAGRALAAVIGAGLTAPLLRLGATSAGPWLRRSNSCRNSNRPRLADQDPRPLD
jgi:hypothetical protein